MRASALERLGRRLTPATLNTVTQSLNDTDPVVRLAAVEAVSNTEQKRAPDSLRSLREAATLEPANARIAYLYAVALNDAGQSREALKVLDAALTRHPYDRDLLSGLAHFSAQWGNRKLTLDYVKQLRELDPENADYARMAKQIEGAR